MYDEWIVNSNDPYGWFMGSPRILRQEKQKLKIIQMGHATVLSIFLVGQLAEKIMRRS